MKKIILLLLVMVMALTLMACGGSDNTENNKKMQAKFDEVETLVQEICDWYKDNGYLEGDSAAEFQSVVDDLKSQVEELNASNQDILDVDGYSDETAVEMGEILDTAIVEYKALKEELKTLKETTEQATNITLLADKYVELVDIVNEASEKAQENGWDADEAFNSELKAAIAILDLVKTDLEKPESITDEYMTELLTSFDEMLPTWKDYLVQVSEQYEKK